MKVWRRSSDPPAPPPMKYVAFGSRWTSCTPESCPGWSSMAPSSNVDRGSKEKIRVAGPAASRIRAVPCPWYTPLSITTGGRSARTVNHMAKA
eukprot:scaffold90949_cov60-Phaeocystis_antarctica.AAC.5